MIDGSTTVKGGGREMISSGATVKGGGKGDLGVPKRLIQQLVQHVLGVLEHRVHLRDDRSVRHCRRAGEAAGLGGVTLSNSSVLSPPGSNAVPQAQQKGQCLTARHAAANSAMSSTSPVPWPSPWVSPSRRRDCHSADVPSPSMLKHLLKGEGGAANDSLADG